MNSQKSQKRNLDADTNRVRALRQVARRFALLATAAQGANQYAPAVAARGRADQALAEIRAIHDAQALAQLGDELERARRIRDAAVASGSWQAAKDCERDVREIERRRDAERRAAEDALLANPDTVLADIERMVRGLPAAMQQRLVASLAPN